MINSHGIPSFVPIGNLANLREELAQIHDNSLSDAEMLISMIRAVNRMGLLVGEMADNWAQVETWIKTNGVDEAVTGLLNRWASDGTLAKILDKTALRELNANIDTLRSEIRNAVTNMTSSNNDMWNRVQNLIKDTLNGGAIKGVFSTLNELQAKYPNGADGIFLVMANQHLYYWDTSKWSDAGAYISPEPTENSLTARMLAEDLRNDGYFKGVYFPQTKSTVIGNKLANTTSLLQHLDYLLNIKIINAKPDYNYIVGGIYFGDNGNYGVLVGRAPRIDNRTINDSDVEWLNAGKLKTGKPMPDQYNHYNYTYKTNDETIIATYQYVENDKKGLLLYVDSINHYYYDSCIIDENNYYYETESFGLRKNHGVNYPLVNFKVPNNGLDNSKELSVHNNSLLDVKVINPKKGYSYILLSLLNNENYNGAEVGIVPRIDGVSFDKTKVERFAEPDKGVKITSHNNICTSIITRGETTIIVTYDNSNINEQLLYVDLDGNKWYDTCLIDESCYIGDNNAKYYPLVNYPIKNGNSLANHFPLSQHTIVLRDIKIINPDHALSYFVTGIYFSDTYKRYGMSFATQSRTDGVSYNPENTFDQFEGITNVKPSIDEDGLYTFTLEHGETKIIALLDVGYLKSIGKEQVLYIDTNLKAFYDITLISEFTYIDINKSTDVSHVSYDKPTWLGDSITEHNNKASIHFDEILSKIWGSSRSTNLGISGSTIGNISNSFTERYTDIPTDSDLICVYGGINDFGKNQPLGKIGDTDNTTFYGALDVLCKGLQTKYPKVDKLFVSHVHIGSGFGGYFSSEKNELGLTQLDYENAINEVTAMYSIPHLSLYRNGGMNFWIKEQGDYFSADTLHPNDEGQKKIARKIKQILE